ncbi:hypothetical protein DFH09DRAFT_1101440 [Mycena vulgaris]|nr:hypothetical protein DFH09DRAFT_1101440 [Mycena vulgaris]
MTSDGSTEPLVATYAVWSHPVTHCQKAIKWLQWLLRKLTISTGEHTVSRQTCKQRKGAKAAAEMIRAINIARDCRTFPKSGFPPVSPNVERESATVGFQIFTEENIREL